MPDFTLKEGGFPGIKRIFDTVRNVLGQELIVVNGEEFQNAPNEVLKRYCQMTGISFRDTTQWGNKPVLKEWLDWSDWHKVAIEEKAVGQQPVKENVPVPPHIEEMIRYSLPLYKEMNAFAIRPVSV
jgi:hypothetical protein